ncbi:MAG: hypothetical protein AAFY76_01585 [Cyanobacteria bacterium J06649_11]
MTGSCFKAKDKLNELEDETVECLNERSIDDINKTSLVFDDNLRSNLKQRLDTVGIGDFKKYFAELDLECYEFTDNGPIDWLYKNHQHYNQLICIELGNDSIIEYYLEGYLISFEMENDSIYRLEYSTDGEVGLVLYLVTLSSSFEEIDRVLLGKLGGDEEDYFRMKGCYLSATEYLREDFSGSPVIYEAVYEERTTTCRVTINPDGSINEEILTANVDTISTLIEEGEYVTLGGDSLLRVLPRKRIQLLTYDKDRQVVDSLFGQYIYYGRQPFAEIELIKQDIDQYGVQVYKSLYDTVEIVEKWSCLKYGKEKYYKNE